ncbi:vacuolar (h+)-atpase g subunit protein [Cystoisospora suis]|uniref:Vacuolar (H+)-atpase g subunit protein n=1 Tax=Cystoisospora suis TaxID=483139 RepID=A0A2C6LAB2_9APIC|nr:vacuolar (h+)-atpase g subunit protein [Cystoisospora suis]
MLRRRSKGSKTSGGEGGGGDRSLSHANSSRGGGPSSSRWEEAGSTNPNTPVIEDPHHPAGSANPNRTGEEGSKTGGGGGAGGTFRSGSSRGKNSLRGGEAVSGAGGPSSSSADPPQSGGLQKGESGGSPSGRRQQGSRLFSRITSKFSRSFSAFRHSPASIPGGGGSRFDGGNRGGPTGEQRGQQPGESYVSQEGHAGGSGANHHMNSSAGGGEAGGGGFSSNDAIEGGGSPPLQTHHSKRKFHIPHPHLPGHHHRLSVRQSQVGSGTGAEGATTASGAGDQHQHAGGGGGGALLGGRLHPSHLPFRLHGGHRDEGGHAADGTGVGGVAGGGASDGGVSHQHGVELLKQLHQAQERAKHIVQISKRQKETLLQRARAEVEEEAAVIRKQMDEEFGELAETEHGADQVFIAETEHQDFKIDLPQKLKDDAAQFCYEQVLKVDVNIPEDVRRRIAVIKANPPTFFRKSCASQYPTTRSTSDPAILKAALDHSYRRSRGDAEAHYGSASSMTPEDLGTEYRGAALDAIGGLDPSARESKRETYAAILGDRSGWNEDEDDEFRLDPSELRDTGGLIGIGPEKDRKEGDNGEGGSQTKGGEGGRGGSSADLGSMAKRAQAVCQCWPSPEPPPPSGR